MSDIKSKLFCIGMTIVMIICESALIGVTIGKGLEHDGLLFGIVLTAFVLITPGMVAFEIFLFKDFGG